MNKRTDLELIELSKVESENSDEAKEELFKRCKDKISYNIQKYKGLHKKDLNKSDIEDLISECNIAVMEAISLWDVERCASFATFSGFVIRTRILRFLEKKTKFGDYEVYGKNLEIIRAPLSVIDIMRDLTIKVKNQRDKFIIDLFLQGMRETDIADEFKISKGRVSQIIKSCVK